MVSDNVKSERKGTKLGDEEDTGNAVKSQRRSNRQFMEPQRYGVGCSWIDLEAMSVTNASRSSSRSLGFANALKASKLDHSME